MSVVSPIGVGELTPLPPHLDMTFGDTSVRDAKKKLWELSRPDTGKLPASNIKYALTRCKRLTLTPRRRAIRP